MSAPNGQAQQLTAWQVILSMIRFRFGFWLIDLVSVLFFRLAWQILPGLALKVFFDLLTGEGQSGFNIWTVTAILAATILKLILCWQLWQPRPVMLSWASWSPATATATPIC